MPSSYTALLNGNSRCDACGNAYDAYSIDSHVSEIWCDECESSFCAYSIHYCDTQEELGEYPLSYSYKPAPQFFGGDEWHVGLELEVSASSSRVTPIYEWANSSDARGLFYVKEDSSVRGFEIVTHPMTPGFFRSLNWESFFDMLNAEYPTRRRASGETESREHGLHVHVESAAFPTRTSMGRWAYLLNRCPRDLWQAIARRNPDSWGAQSPNPVSGMLAMRHWEYVIRKNRRPQPEPRMPEAPRRPRGHRTNWDMRNPNASYYSCGCPNGESCYEHSLWAQQFEDVRREYHRALRAWRNGDSNVPSRFGHLPRYSAINYGPQVTAEVRSFRSTRDPHTLRQSVGTVIASVDYSTDNSVWRNSPASAARWDSFVEWCAKHETHSDVYPTVAGIPAHGATMTVANSEGIN